MTTRKPNRCLSPSSLTVPHLTVLFQVLLIPLLFANFAVEARRTENQPAQYQYAFQNADLPIDERVNNIISLMTLEEKLACLGTDPSVPRLGIKGSRHVE